MQRVVVEVGQELLLPLVEHAGTELGDGHDVEQQNEKADRQADRNDYP